jgi:hypothetical protein
MHHNLHPRQCTGIPLVVLIVHATDKQSGPFQSITYVSRRKPGLYTARWRANARPNTPVETQIDEEETRGSSSTTARTLRLEDFDGTI